MLRSLLLALLLGCVATPQGVVLYDQFTGHYATPQDEVEYETSVRITVVCPEGMSAGSGFVVSRRHVITAEHVASCFQEKALSITVIMRNGAEIPMMLEASDKEADAARLVALTRKPPFKMIAPIRLFPRLSVGEAVCSIGGDRPNIYGIKKCGYVSDLGRSQHESWSPPTHKKAFWVQHSIPVVPGNSGSAIFDSGGRVVALVSTWNGSFHREQGGGGFSVWGWIGILPIVDLGWAAL